MIRPSDWKAGASVLLVLSTAGAEAAAQCGEWDNRLSAPEGVNMPAYATTTFDPDGGGPLERELIVGGAFTIAGGAPAASLARWDGSQWRAVGGGTNGTVYALHNWDPDGAGPLPAQLIAGGNFAQAGGDTANNIARWDGETWEPLAGGFPGSAPHRVAALTTWDPDDNGPLPPTLIAAGNFTSPANRIASWDGTGWSSLGVGLSGGAAPQGYALTTWDPDGAGPLTPQLIVGGSFTIAGTTSASNIARWDGSLWHAFGAGTGGTVRALTTWDPDGDGPLAAELVAAGDFTTAGGQPANRVARWNGTTWQRFDLGFSGSAQVITTWDSDGAGPLPPLLIGGGSFESAGALAVEKIAYWGGTLWLPLDGGIDGFFSHTVYGLTAWDPDGAGPVAEQLACVGNFQSVSIGEDPAHHVACWDGNLWQPIGAGFNDTVESLVLWDADGAGPAGPQIVAAGEFTAAFGTRVNRVARWDGQVWQPFGSGIDQRVWSIASWDPDGPGGLTPQLVAGGIFFTAGGLTVNHIARWDGVAWRALGGGFFSNIYAVTSWDEDGEGLLPPTLVAGGSNVHRWTGTAWEMMGADMGSARALTTWDSDGDGPLPPSLIAGGYFDYTNGPQRIARWDGAAWQSLGGGLGNQVSNTQVSALVSWDPDGDGPQTPQLVAGGDFTISQGAPVNYLACWNGAAWVALGGGVSGRVLALAVWDPDASGPLGPQLVASGNLSTAGGIPVSGIARWDGQNWHAFGPGGVGARALLPLPPDDEPFGRRLIVGGSFTLAGGRPAAYVTAWTTLDPELVINDQPDSVSICRGETASFSVAATGTGTLTYRWRKNGLNVADGTGGGGSIISGASTPTLVIAQVAAANAGSYDCVVSSTCGLTTSAVATLEALICPSSGDVNCDGELNFFDIDPFVLALVSPAEYGQAYPGCDIDYADMNGDGSVNFFDIDPFLACLFGECP